MDPCPDILLAQAQSWARRFVRDRTDREDFVQELALRAWRARDQLADPDRFEGWLSRIAAHLATDWGRRRAVRSAAIRTETGLTACAVDPRDGPGREARDALEALHRAIGRLPERLGETLTAFAAVCTERPGPSHGQLAAALGVSPSVLSTRLCRARQALRDELDRDAGA